MNKRGPTGLPTKPYMQNNVGQNLAPPLPSGPPPAQMQQQYNQQGQVVDQAAHAAAWAAYYQAQGVNPAASYSAAPQPAPVTGAPGTAANPYANYGYGAGATHGGYQPPVQQGVAGPSQPFAPQPNAQGYATAQPQYGQQYPQQPQAYSPNPVTAGYSTPQPQPQIPIQGQGRPPYQQPGGYGWGAQQPTTPVGAPGYRPPQAGVVQQQQVGTSYPQQAGPYYPQQPQTQQPQQPFAGNVNQPYRPTMTPQQHSPYRPPGINQHRPPRPPIQTPLRAGVAGFPPAKRPRFDGPGSIGGGGIGNVRPPNGPMQNSINRPPSAPASFNSSTGVNGGQPGFNSSPSSRGGLGGGGGVGRGGAPIPSTRPPIHLGGGGPPPFGIGIGRGGAGLRGGLGGRGGRGGPSGIGMVGAPRGPSGMMRRDNNRSSLPPVKKELPKKEKRKEELRTTMTDFRIVGIEVKGLDWSWGKIGGQVEEEEGVYKEEENIENAPVSEEKLEPEVPADPTEVKEEKVDSGNAEETVVESKVEGNPEEVKVESAETNGGVDGPVGAEAVEEKRGEKRKAKSPDSEEETSAKKRTSSYILTHNKPNDAKTTNTETTSLSIFESNQNRFRIYFDSPPELDRIPKSARRKRGRESSSVAPSRIGDAEGEVEHEHDAEVEGVEHEQEHEEGHEVEAEGIKEEEVDVPHQPEGVTEPVQEIQVSQEVEQAITDLIEGSVVPTIEEAVGELTVPEVPTTEITETTVPQIDKTEQISETIAEVPLPSAEQVVEAETAENVGDVSMSTDPGLVLAVEAEVGTTEPQAIDNTVVGTTEVSNQQATSDSNVENAEYVVNGEATEPGTEEPAQQATTAPADESHEPSETPNIKTRRHSVASSTEEYQTTIPGDHQPTTTSTKSIPSTNRLSILYEKSSRRICIDSDVVEKVRIWRKDGKIEVEFKDLKGEKKEGESESGEGVGLPKGILVESYDSKDQRFITINPSNISTFFSEDLPNEEGRSIPPFHQFHKFDSQSHLQIENQDQNQNQQGLTLTVFLNKKNPLSEPKWCRNNSADNWLYEQFGSRRLEKDEFDFGIGKGSGGWLGKLEVMDPDPAPTLKSILESWSSSSTLGSPISRQTFILSLLSSPLDTLEILLRLTRGDRNPIYSSNPIAFKSFSNIIRKDSAYTNHQTHISLAILAMYRLTTNLVDRVASASNSGEEEARKLEEKKKLDENINDIITSLPINMIQRSLDGLWKEWNANNGAKKAGSVAAVSGTVSVPGSGSDVSKMEVAGSGEDKDKDEKAK